MSDGIYWEVPECAHEFRKLGDGVEMMIKADDEADTPPAAGLEDRAAVVKYLPWVRRLPASEDELAG